MAYQICISKTSPCCVIPWTIVCTPSAGNPSIRTLDVFGCTPDLTQGENHNNCKQGNYIPAGNSCTWIVPAGVTSITVEMWGAGGGGGSSPEATCCGKTPGAGAGSYMKRQFAVAAGDTMLVCAGAGGCGGQGTEGIETYCCCGPRGSPSFICRNGTVCLDSQGGGYGISDCYHQCGCMWFNTCGNNYGLSGCGPCGSNGSWGGCTANSPDIRSGPTVASVTGCGGACTWAAGSWSAGTTFGGENVFSSARCMCWGYLRSNTACTNTLGIAGVGGDGTIGGCAYNTPGTANYACAADSAWVSCSRAQYGLPGAFPGGGGTSGSPSVCCYSHGTGGHGASGYVRIWY